MSLDVKKHNVTIENVKRCARCLGDHDKVVARPLTNQMDIDEATFFTHFFMCPTLEEPVIVTVTSML